MGVHTISIFTCLIFSQFYATAASGRKDVVIVMDITTSEGLPVTMAAVRDLLNTLSALDYFIIINSSLTDNDGKLLQS